MAELLKPFQPQSMAKAKEQCAYKPKLMANRARAYSNFCSMNRLRVILLPTGSGWDACALQGYLPPQY